MDEMKMDKRGWTAYLQDKSPQELAKLAKENNIRISDIPGVENKIDKLSDILGMPEEFKKIVYGGKDFPLTPENTKALGRAVDDDILAKIAKQGEFIDFNKPNITEINLSPRVKALYKKPLPYVGPAMAAGEVLAGENDIGKMAAGVIGSDLLATLGAAAPGNALVKGIATGAGAVAGYPAGQAVYKKIVPESVQEKLKLSPEERAKIKEMFSKIKKKVL
jgi:hypothetical protein